MSDTSPNAEVLGFPRKPEDRLRLALRRLDEALEQQRQVLAEWRASMKDLAGSVDGLKSSLETYQGSLADLAVDVNRLGDEARALEETAGRAAPQGS